MTVTFDKKAYMRQWYDDHPTYLKDRKKREPEKYRKAPQQRWYVKHRLRILENLQIQAYGMTNLDLTAFIAKQNGICPICLLGLPNIEERIKIAIDHDHTTGRVRGVLHRRCNGNLGFYEKNRTRIETYLGGVTC